MGIKNKKTIAIVLTLILVGFGLVYYFVYRDRSGDKQDYQYSQTEADKSVGEVPTKDVTIDDKTVQVPENVPSEKIKNYKLITENEAFKIRELDGEYVITLYAIINRPDQRDSYRDQLAEYKRQALDYLKNTKKLDVDKLNIRYDPDEAKDL